MSPDLEDLIPGLREARARERLNRALAFVGITRTVCGAELLPLTPQSRLELQLARNACIAGVPPLAGDVFQFMWVLHPSRGKITSGFARNRLRKLVLGLDLERAAREIALMLADQLQDLAGVSSGPLIGDVSDYVHWMAVEAGFWIDVHGGFTLESYRKTPYLVLQQLHRAWRCNHPNLLQNPDGTASIEQPSFINESDRLVGDWQRARKKEITEAILNQRERLPN